MTLQSLGCALNLALGYVERLGVRVRYRTSGALRDSIDPPIIKVRYAVVLVLHLLKLEVRAHLAEIPETEDLVLAIRDDVPSVALGGDVRDTFCVPNKDTGGLWR